MGTYAYGNGVLMPKPNVTIPGEVIQLLARDFTYVEDSPDGGLWLTFEYGKYDDVEDSMKSIAPYIKSGQVTFHNEYDDYYGFEFEDGKVYGLDGEVVYTRTSWNLNGGDNVCLPLNGVENNARSV